MKVTNIAKDIIYLCKKYNYPCNHTKVQKLLFLYIGFCLLNGVRADEESSLDLDSNEVETMTIVDEQPKAWPYGPVFSKVNNKYHEIEMEALTEPYSLKIKDEPNKSILAETVKKYGRVDSGQLTEWLQKAGSPWDSVKQIDGTGWNTVIPLDLIREYFDNNIENIIVKQTSAPKQVVNS